MRNDSSTYSATIKILDRIRGLFGQRSRELPPPDSERRREAVELLTRTPIDELLARRRELQRAAQDAGLTPGEIRDTLNARPDLPRPLLPVERETLLALLRHADFEGRDELVAQVDSATVVGYCGCGCASVDLAVARVASRASVAPSVLPNSATVLDAAGDAIGGIVVFLEDGYLSYLEIYDWLEVPGISPLPPVERLRTVQDRRPT
jgi:hypothetical protein